MRVVEEDRNEDFIVRRGEAEGEVGRVEVGRPNRMRGRILGKNEKYRQ